MCLMLLTIVTTVSLRSHTCYCNSTTSCFVFTTCLLLPTTCLLHLLRSRSESLGKLENVRESSRGSAEEVENVEEGGRGEGRRREVGESRNSLNTYGGGTRMKKCEKKYKSTPLRDFQDYLWVELFTENKTRPVPGLSEAC